jgi:glucose-6-phosphate isomerase
LTPTALPAWQQLASLATNLRDASLPDLVADNARNQRLRLQVAGCTFDYTKQRVDGAVIDELLALASARQVFEHAGRMLRGDIVNPTENRPALHSALRHGAPDAGDDIKRDVTDVQRRMHTCAQAIRSGQWRGYTNKPITDVVHIGIGGSHLGPELVVEALADYKTTRLNIHFVANIDAADLQTALRGLNPETTLFIVVSKSFATLETQLNAATARSWFLERTTRPEAIAQHFIGVTTNLTAAAEFGMSESNLFPMWDWVGGRFSLWSAVGLPILLSIGTDNFNALLAGAAEVDRHFATTPAEENVPLLSALLATWNYNFLGAASLAVLPYDERLGLLPDYLQQLEMESNGKSVTLAGEPVDTHTMPILWGGTGTRG